MYVYTYVRACVCGWLQIRPQLIETNTSHRSEDACGGLDTPLLHLHVILNEMPEYNRKLHSDIKLITHYYIELHALEV